MFKAIHMAVTMYRTNKIAKMLKEVHNFEIRNDMATVDLVIKFVMVRTLSDEQIVKEIMEMHTIQEALFAKKERH